MQRDLANSAVRSARSSSSAAVSDWRRAAWTASSANSDDTGCLSLDPDQLAVDPCAALAPELGWSLWQGRLDEYPLCPCLMNGERTDCCCDAR
jgi:hypothetical protein